MSKIILPKTIPGLLKRQFHIWEVKYGELIQERLHKLMIEKDSELDCLKFKDFKFELLVFQECDDDDDDEGDCYLEVWFSVGKMLIFSVRLTQKERFENFISSDEFKLEYDFCPCGDIVFENDMCEICFLYDYQHDENCCICLENGRRWVELKCGHVLHSNCWVKINTNKCPLCRDTRGTKNRMFGFGDER
jgi:hypothetical protein